MEDLPYDRLPRVPRTNSLIPSGVGHYYTAENAKEKTLYTVDRLNDEQKSVYLHMYDRPSDIVLIQAGPGTGKTFTLMALAHAWTRPTHVVIFKNDLLHTFRNCAERHTVAAFCMSLWQINFYEWCALERQLSGSMSSEQFVAVVVGLLRKAVMPRSLVGSLVLLDEYTVIPKPVLFVMLALFRRHGVGVVISGDKNQLQNIHNSAHVGKCSSHDIASAFADRTFLLTKNERCCDGAYNRLVDYVSRYSSDRPLDKFGYALVAAIFHKKFMSSTTINDTHLASNHRDLTNTVHMMTVNGRYRTSFYHINASGARFPERVKGTLQPNGLYLPAVTVSYMASGRPGKYLPYVPLVVGGRYFVYKYSEHSLCTLEFINDDDHTVTLRADDGRLVKVGMGNCNDVVFDKHRQWILNGGVEIGGGGQGVGQLYNYPIYMANAMSIHMCQGRTIRDQALDIMLNGSTYQGLYVSMSRVTSPRQINRVIVPDMPAHLVSTVINFPQLCRRDTLNVDELHACFGGNYLHYPISDPLLSASVAHWISSFFASREERARHNIRAGLCKALEIAACTPVVLNHAERSPNDRLGATMTFVLRYRNAMMAAALLDPSDAAVWLHEFAANDPLLETDRRTSESSRYNGLGDDRYKTVREVSGVEKSGYRTHERENTLQYIYRHARWTEVVNGVPECAYIASKDTMVLRSTPFQSLVYGRLKAGLPVDADWLMEKLRLQMDSMSTPPPTPAPSAVPDVVACAVNVQQLLDRIRYDMKKRRRRRDDHGDTVAAAASDDDDDDDELQKRKYRRRRRQRVTETEAGTPITTATTVGNASSATTT